jgi:hypothetical protein
MRLRCLTAFRSAWRWEMSLPLRMGSPWRCCLSALIEMEKLSPSLTGYQQTRWQTVNRWHLGSQMASVCASQWGNWRGRLRGNQLQTPWPMVMTTDSKFRWRS